MADQSSTCGTPDGVTHTHSERCWKDGYAAGVADTVIAATRVQSGDETDG